MDRGHLHLLRQSSPLAGKTVTVHPAKGTEFEYLIDGAEFFVEDWYENVNGETWTDSSIRGIFAAVHYLRRVMASGLPDDNDVLYGHIGPLGYLVHISEVEQPVETKANAADIPDEDDFVIAAPKNWRDYEDLYLGEFQGQWDKAA